MIYNYNDSLKLFRRQKSEQTIFVAWKESGLGLVGIIDKISGVFCIPFGAGVCVQDFYPIDRLMETEGWIHQKLGKGRHLIVNTKHAGEFLKLQKSGELRGWMARS